MKYNKEDEISYTFGAFPTVELLKNKPKSINRIIFSDKLNITDDVKKIEELAKTNGVKIETNGKLISKIVDKDNIFIVGEFKKYEDKFVDDNYICLVNPSDMGNLGTVIRTAVGFGIKNLAIIRPNADYFNPKTIRASMGAIFSINIKTFESFEEFNKTILDYDKYMFALDGETYLSNLKIDKNRKYCLVFGNEATGLSEEVKSYGKKILIKHTQKIDSLNLSISIGIAIYEFNKQTILNK
jgi:RNA methyltransferase, TrmH family